MKAANQVYVTFFLSCSEYAREKIWARIHLIPLLQAEEDRDQVRRHLADQQREKELLGENTKVYHGDRYVWPSLLLTRCLRSLIADEVVNYRFVRPTYSIGPAVTK